MTLSNRLRKQILEFFDSDLTIQDVASKMNVSVGSVYNIWSQEHTDSELKQRRARLTSGENHPNWKGGVTTTSKGYRLIKAPEWYKGYVDPAGRAPEHLIKWCEYNGKVHVPSGHIVHHRNEDKTDISPENLELLSQSEHSTTHASRRTRDWNGKFI